MKTMNQIAFNSLSWDISRALKSIDQQILDTAQTVRSLELAIEVASKTGDTTIKSFDIGLKCGKLAAVEQLQTVRHHLVMIKSTLGDFATKEQHKTYKELRVAEDMLNSVE